MEALLRLTDWTMTEPVVGSAFHIVIACVGVLISIITAVAFAKKQRLSASEKLQKTKGDMSENLQWHIDLIVGLALLFSEIYKQLFRYYIVDGRHYCVEFVPFQLCSLPMYLCLINAGLVYIQHQHKKRCRSAHIEQGISSIVCAINMFIIDFNLMGALMVFIDPSGIFSKYVVLTVHGILWHLLLIFLGVYKGLTCPDTHQSMSSFVKTLPIFFAGCGIATILNIVLHPYGFISMFYISPYEPSIQIIFSDIAAKYGITAGNIAYVVAMLLGGVVFHEIFCLIQRKMKIKNICTVR